VAFCSRKREREGDRRRREKQKARDMHVEGRDFGHSIEVVLKILRRVIFQVRWRNEERAAETRFYIPLSSTFSKRSGNTPQSHRVFTFSFAKLRTRDPHISIAHLSNFSKHTLHVSIMFRKERRHTRVVVILWQYAAKDRRHSSASCVF
jgi:hypothetical protein